MVESAIRYESVDRVSAGSGAVAPYRPCRFVAAVRVRGGCKRNHRRGVNFRQRLLLLGSTDGSHQDPVCKVHPPASVQRYGAGPAVGETRCCARCASGHLRRAPTRRREGDLGGELAGAGQRITSIWDQVDGGDADRTVYIRRELASEALFHESIAEGRRLWEVAYELPLSTTETKPTPVPSEAR